MEHKMFDEDELWNRHKAIKQERIWSARASILAIVALSLGLWTIIWLVVRTLI